MPGGTLDPTAIPKYVTPLVIPPVLYDDRGGQSPLDVLVSLRQFTQQILPPTDTNGAPLPPTPLWGYGDPTEPVTYFNPSFTMWLPAAGNIDCAGVGPDRPNVPNYACNGTFFESAEGADTANALGEGYAIDLYSNDQPTTTL